MVLTRVGLDTIVQNIVWLPMSKYGSRIFRYMLKFYVILIFIIYNYSYIYIYIYVILSWNRSIKELEDGGTKHFLFMRISVSYLEKIGLKEIKQETLSRWKRR